ncbi:MAG: nucleotidyltransferase domain-containing protein [Candidatus Hatepunaea meridiana]|nr:nucleotidyltransferase domain-containing protein [Candidatus Hatepunaea meridiana]
MPIKIQIDKQKLTRFCRKHHIRKLWLFGSVLHDDFRDDSDIDVLYEFEPDTMVGFKIFRIEEELSVLFGNRKIDFIAEEFLNHRIRNHSTFQAEVIYEKG